MSFFQKLFGKATAEPAQPESTEHKGFSIAVSPMKDNGQYRLHAVITKEIDGAVKQHMLIRADLFSSIEECNAASLKKAIQVIDEQGESILSD
jgi:hypothetical protein